MSINPALQRLYMVICMCILVTFFTSILVQIGKGNEISLCQSNITIKKTCWDWKLSNYKQTFSCPFTLLFVGLLLYSISLFMFVMTGIVKCICPEIVMVSYRTTCCRLFSQYYTLILHLAANIFVFVFIIFVLAFSYKTDSCYYSGDMMRNCTHNRSQCWMLCLSCIGFVACLFATMFSAFEARKFYVERLDDELCDQLYNNYITSGSHEYLKTI